MSDSLIYTEVEERARELAKGKKLPFPNKPTTDLAFPSDLSDIRGDALSEHLAYWTGLAAYCRFQLAVFSSSARRAQLEADQEFDARYASDSHKHVTDKRHLTGANRAVRSKQRQAMQIKNDAEIIGALLDGYEKKYNAISREISRREKEREMS